MVLADYKQYRYWSEEELVLLDIIANQIYIAIHQAELYMSAKQYGERESLLRTIYTTMSTTLDINVLKKTIVTEIGKVLGADFCLIVVYDKEKDFFIIDQFSEYRSAGTEKSFVGFDTGSTWVNWFKESFKKRQEIHYSNVEDFLRENNLHGTKEEEFLNYFEIKSSYTIPIYYANSYGYIILHYTKSYKKLSQAEIDFLGLIAVQAGIALHQANLYKITQSQAEREKFNRNILEILRGTLDKATIKSLFVTNIGKLFNADRVFFADYDEVAHIYLPLDKNSEYLSDQKVKSFTGYDWSNHFIREYIQPLLEKREFKISCWDKYIQEFHKSTGFIARFVDYDVKSSYNFPVLYQDKIMGYFCVEFTKDVCVELSEEDIARIRGICAHAAIALFQADLYVQAKESSKIKGDFISGIYNELKDPLERIIDIAVILETIQPDEIKNNQYLNKIKEHCNRLQDIRNDIFDIAFLESEDFRLSVSKINSKVAITKAIESLGHFCASKNVCLSPSLSSVIIKADEEKLQKIVYNLLVSAINHIPSNHIIKVYSSAKINDFNLVIDIEGKTLDENVQNIVFEKFKPLDTDYQGGSKSLGLALSLVKKLIKLHHGLLAVDSIEDRGTRVTLILPNSVLDQKF